MNETVPGTQPWDRPGAFNANPPPEPTREPRQKRKPRAAPVVPKTRKARAASVPAETAPPAAAKPARKPRKAKPEKSERAAPETIRVSLKDFAQMRVGPDDAKLFLKLHGLLSGVGKSARVKVLAEIQKVFG